ncbi:type II secretion system minor pseudopilin GspI [Yersinia hibernica]|uniref:Type II secretion system protein I n=1 Tax=Yersinia enterocolitica LC20 TaxID=1443113 RepID=A0A7U4K0B9_YEREN|nr:type II secretion system minor pseudopilin GspI [Yersinia hibernica]AHM72330.2 type II secretion system protein GspI [Yersinia hibernica]OVZ90016.1 type II secretion system protein GspI [Yersinia kristensenii]
MRYCTGFTLLESILSLAIFSIVGIGIMVVMSEQLIRVKTLEDKIMASWVADNIIAEINLAKIAQTENWLRGHDIMGNKVWYWQSREIKTQSIGIITVEVRSQEGSRTPDYILQGYRALDE